MSSSIDFLAPVLENDIETMFVRNDRCVFPIDCFDLLVDSCNEGIKVDQIDRIPGCFRLEEMWDIDIKIVPDDLAMVVIANARSAAYSIKI